MIKHLRNWVITNLIWRQRHFRRTYREFQKLRPVMTTSRFWLSHYNKNGPNVMYRQQSTRYCHHFNELLQLGVVKKYIGSLKEKYKEINNGVNYIPPQNEDGKLLSTRHVELAPLIPLLEEMHSSEKDLLELESMYKSVKARADQELILLVLEERQQLIKSIEVLQGKLLQTLVQRDEHDKSNVILEVTAGRTTGGDICQQFTREIFDMYKHYADYKDWNFEVLNYTPADYGGLHHASACVSGENAYRFLKHEGGTHRVQRIPEVGLSSRMQRIHTGTMTVIVLPEIDEVDIKVDVNDLKIDTFRAKGAGGQHVNTTDSAVRIVHIPTGLTIECQQHRSQLENKKLAMRTLKAKLYQGVADKELEKRQSTRKLQVGTRAQSERIRTYNFTQDRVTDHRINYVLRDIKEVLCGGRQLDELINKLLESAEKEALLELIETSNKRVTE
ncbi:peptide chain release factor 1, mitochondrial-like [Pristis pectinata]|uniref:peptide chain release factor 1, mitochondrial-like n=1 Tax=Pristis pectinata TaxID=685728 RepID=UPI00223E3BE9|nr:peptide chain release factor 1, mitochondrial-like [Pristis pectinata]XP_051869644.1 peptide chain release factor 1, mitochondrial-like [Pristis pectinata]